MRLVVPPADPAGELQPPGCAEPTFTGTAFDIQEVSLEAVRTVVGLLSTDYPESPWDVAMLRLRADDGTRVPPSWRGEKIQRIEGCPTCGTP